MKHLAGGYTLKALRALAGTSLVIGFGYILISVVSLASANQAATLPETTLRTNQQTDQRALLSNSKSALEWDLGVSGQSFEDKFNQSLFTRFKLDLKADAKLGEYFKVFGSTRLQTEQGQAQGLDIEPNRRSSGVYLLEAGGETRFEIYPELEAGLRLGALRPGNRYTSFLLLSGQTFPGVEQSLSWKTKNTKLTFTANQMIATSTSLSTKAVSKEPLPLFVSERIEFVQDWSQWLSTRLQLTHFQFIDLPEKVAYESRLYGNSVDTIVIGRGRFINGFEGYQPSFSIKGDIGRFSLVYDTQYLINTEAPAGQNEGLTNSAGFISPFGKNAKLQLVGGVFQNEADTSPAFYNSWNHGHNNVRGEFARLDVLLAEPQFKITAYYSHFDLLDNRPYQSDGQYFSLSLETGYDDFF